MHKKVISMMLTSVLAFLFSTSASACGESLYRVGKGVVFREYTAPLPGRILALATDESDLMMASILRDAGHDVYVVRTVEQIGAKLTGTDIDFDVIITMYEKHDAVQKEIARTGSTASYLPVAEAERNQLDQARMINRDAPSSDDRARTFLRAIHHTLVRKQGV